MRDFYQEGGGLRIGYLLEGDPAVGETALLNELRALEAEGVSIEVFSLGRPSPEAGQGWRHGLRARVTYLSVDDLAAGCTLQEVGEADDRPVAAALHALLESDVYPGRLLVPARSAEERIALHLKAALLALLAGRRELHHLHALSCGDAAEVALLAGRLCDVTVSIAARDSELPGQADDPVGEAAARRRRISEAAFVTAVSEDCRCRVIALAGPQAERKIHRIYDGIDLDRFRPHAGAREPRLMVAPGRLVEENGFIHLVESCRLLAEQGLRFRCLVLGEGPERARLAQAIDVAAVNDWISLVGPLPEADARDIMGRAACAVLPRLAGSGVGDGGLPRMLLEALAHGVPAISSRLPGISEVIEEGSCGLLVDPGDAPGLAVAMAELLCDPDRRRAMGAAGRARAERLFDLKRNMACLKDLFFAAAGCAGGIRAVG